MPLRLAIFDFDQTLSTVHFYNALAGDESSWRLPSPHARTEAGQLARIAELEAAPEFRQQGGLVLAAFGGQERVAQLRDLLHQLVGNGVECIICSKGLVGPVRKCLDQLGLLQFFSKVYANVGSTYGATPYDRQLPPGVLGADSRFLGSPDLADWNNNKQVLVSRSIRERGLRGSEAVFVDDQPAEIESVRSVCPTVHVQAQRGIGHREIELLRNLLVGSPTGGNGVAQLPTAALGDYGQSHGLSASRSPSPRERSSFGGTEAQVQSAGAGSQGSSLHRQASRAGQPPSSATMPPMSCPSMVVPSSGWLPPDTPQAPGTLPTSLPQSQQAAALRQAPASFLLPVPPLPLQHGRQGAPVGSAEHAGGYKMAHQQRSQQYLASQSFVRPVPSPEDLGGLPRGDRVGERHPVLEEQSGSFTDSDHGCPAGSRPHCRHSEKKKKGNLGCRCLCQ